MWLAPIKCPSIVSFTLKPKCNGNFRIRGSTRCRPIHLFLILPSAIFALRARRTLWSAIGSVVATHIKWHCMFGHSWWLFFHFYFGSVSIPFKKANKLWPNSEEFQSVGAVWSEIIRKRNACSFAVGTKPIHLQTTCICLCAIVLCLHSISWLSERDNLWVDA